MRIAGFLVLSSLLSSPAMAQAPWEGQQPLPSTAVPGVPYPGYVPGSPYPPGYVPGAPYRYRNEVRRRELEEERFHHNGLAIHPNGRAAASHDPFVADQVAGGSASAAATGTGTTASATLGSPPRLTRGRGKGSASGAVSTASTTSTTATPCKSGRR